MPINNQHTYTNLIDYSKIMKQFNAQLLHAYEPTDITTMNMTINIHMEKVKDYIQSNPGQAYLLQHLLNLKYIRSMYVMASYQNQWCDQVYQTGISYHMGTLPIGMYCDGFLVHQKKVIDKIYLPMLPTVTHRTMNLFYNNHDVDNQSFRLKFETLDDLLIKQEYAYHELLNNSVDGYLKLHANARNIRTKTIFNWLAGVRRYQEQLKDDLNTWYNHQYKSPYNSNGKMIQTILNAYPK